MSIRMSTLVASVSRVQKIITELYDSKSSIYTGTKKNLLLVESICLDIINKIHVIVGASDLDEQQKPIAKSNLETDSQKSEYSVTKRIVSEFASTFESLTNKDQGNPYINDCFAMIWKWYQLRILKAKIYTKFDRHFCYKVSDLRTWIYAIVIYYGWCIENDQVSTFNAKFDSFFGKLGKDEKITCFSPLPYDVYQIARGNAPEYANLTAIYLWESMIDSGLRTLTDTKRYPKASICTSTVMSLVDKWKPGIINDYEEYLLHPLI